MNLPTNITKSFPFFIFVINCDTLRGIRDHPAINTNHILGDKGCVPHLSSVDCGENIKASRGLGTSIS